MQIFVPRVSSIVLVSSRISPAGHPSVRFELIYNITPFSPVLSSALLKIIRSSSTHSIHRLVSIPLNLDSYSTSFQIRDRPHILRLVHSIKISRSHNFLININYVYAVYKYIKLKMNTVLVFKMHPPDEYWPEISPSIFLSNPS